MQLLRSFRLSTYLTLAIACLTLGYAEGGLLPETPFITSIVVVLLAIAFRLEGRWSLSLRAANILGAILFVGLVAWLGFRLTHKPPGLAYLPFPTSLFPFLGPVLLILIPAKVFRPKHVGDFWAMQGIGLLAVSLGCALAMGSIFRLLLVVYLGCFIWSMSLFHLYREIRPQLSSNPKETEPGTSRFYLFRTAARWSAGIVLMGGFLFAITPRPNDKKWELPLTVRGKMETGLPDGKIDLNHTGSSTQNRDIAFEVKAEDADGNPKLDLNLDQRWRTWSLTHYENGIWDVDRHSGLFVLDLTNNRAIPSRSAVTSADPFSEKTDRLPDLGPGEYYLTYTLHLSKAPADRFREVQILADPVLWRPKGAPPILVFGIRAGAVQHRRDGTFEWFSVPSNNRPTYCQATAPTLEPDLGPPLRVANSYQDFLTRMPQRPMSERLRRWSSALLERLIDEGTLTPDSLRDLDPDTQLPLPKHHEAIARALEFHFSHSGEFVYSLNTTLKDRNADPVEDFLFNTKSGKCDQYASALALLLRSQGIPAQIVVGFRGCESRGNGWYDVRQSHAHAWVEVLIVRSPPTAVLPPLLKEPPFPSDASHHWLSLDPTPPGDPVSDTEGGSTNWFESAYERGKSAFRNGLESTASGMEDSLEALQDGDITGQTATIAGGILLLSIGLVCRHYGHRRSTGRHERSSRFHDELLRLLSRHGWEMQAGETALEFTSRAARDLADRPDVADVPLRLAKAYYRARFGEQVLTEAEGQELRTALRRLADALQSQPPESSEGKSASRSGR